MKKLLNFIPFLLLLPSLVGCTEPLIHMPLFSSYGKTVSSEYFYNAIEMAANNSTAGIIVSNSLAKNSQIDCIESHRVIIDKSNYWYYQIDNHTQIDPISLQFRSKTMRRDFYEGLSGPTDEKQKVGLPKKQTEITERYGEVINKYLWCANITRQTVFKTSGDVDSLIPYAFSNGYSSAYSYLSVIFNPKSSLYYTFSDCTYYVNGKTFTLEFNYYEREIAYQIQYGDKISLKAKARTRFSDNQNTKDESYIDFSFKTTNKKIKRVDYSKYTEENYYY